MCDAHDCVLSFEVDIRCLSQLLSSFYMEAESLAEPKLIVLASLASRLVLGISPLCLLSATMPA